ncbi:LacI family DNA-binding transcriptional regulator [Haploplasma axanthum]|uniref:Ribose operon repressor n=1 Tax=Haploplasma axanthum TaxID=29552 RepID=A0A449BE55_HAPAX|nr:LacI family DNA-binding transcriptional regulator [Haploplasma axanthum]VEU80712.1 Ribose operon repressor [Haploplasma axanthum]
MDKRITIYTIAEDLGLAPGTISKIINNKGNVSTETREAVLDYIKRIGYVPSSSARMLKSKRTYTIGVIFSEDMKIGLEQAFFSSILQNFKNYAENKGYELSFIVRKLGKNKMSYYEWCLNKRVDGVYIVVGDYQDKELLELVNSKIPCVSTDMIVDNLHTVISDNAQGIKLALEYIKNELKLKKVAMISGPTRSKAFKERIDYFNNNYKKYELEKTDLIIADGFGFTTGYNSAIELLDKNNNPEVIIASSDDIALGILKAIFDRGFNVPDDIQVIGFDDIAFAKHFTPPLTTIRQDRKKLGERAAKDLISHIENDIFHSKEIVTIPVELIERKTTKKK